MSIVTPKPETAKLIEIIEQFYRDMNNPEFRICYHVVACYVLYARYRSDCLINEGNLQNALIDCIGYAPKILLESLTGVSNAEASCECMILLYSLLTLDFMPPEELRFPIKRILHSSIGDDLEQHILDSLNEEDSFWLQSQLARMPFQAFSSRTQQDWPGNDIEAANPIDGLRVTAQKKALMELSRIALLELALFTTDDCFRENSVSDIECMIYHSITRPANMEARQVSNPTRHSQRPQIPLPDIQRSAKVVLKALIPFLIGNGVHREQMAFNEDTGKLFDICETLRLSRNQTSLISDQSFITALHDKLFESSVEIALDFLSYTILLKLALLGWNFNATRVEDSQSQLKRFVCQSYDEDLWRVIHQRYQGVQRSNVTYEDFQVEIAVIFMY